jgi:cell division protein YceG involved in septum cleavage
MCTTIGMKHKMVSRSIKEKNSDKPFIKQKFWIYGVCLLVFLCLFSVCFFRITAAAEKNTQREKIITSVEIKRGDTLWSIAKSYVSNEYADVGEYIEEIKRSNGLSSNTIHTGNYIIVPYYVDVSSDHAKDAKELQ